MDRITHGHSMQPACHVGRQEGHPLASLEHEQNVVVGVVVHVGRRFHRP